MAKNIEEKCEEILNKKFKQSKIYVGYDPEEVDQFFDENISYLKEVNKEYNVICEKNMKLKKNNEELAKKITELEEKIKLLEKEKELFKKNGYNW